MMTRKYKKFKSTHPTQKFYLSKSCKHITNISTGNTKLIVRPNLQNNDKLLCSLELCRLIDIANIFKYIISLTINYGYFIHEIFNIRKTLIEILQCGFIMD